MGKRLVQVANTVVCGRHYHFGVVRLLELGVHTHPLLDVPFTVARSHEQAWFGGGGPDRTADPRLMSPLLCQLSYTAT